MSKITFSQRTIDVLKNMSLFAKDILFVPGKQLRIASAGKTAVVIAEIQEELPQRFYINQLPGLLSILQLKQFKDCTIEFAAKSETNPIAFLRISNESGSSAKFSESSEKLLINNPYDVPFDKLKASFTKIIEVDLKAEELDEFLKACKPMGHTECHFTARDGVLYMIGTKDDDVGTNEYSMNLGECTASNFDLVTPISQMNMMICDYRIECYENMLSFNTVDDGMEYILTLKTEG